MVIHGGAGGAHWQMDDAKAAAYRAGLRAAYLAGEAVLAAGGAALDGCCAAIQVLEDDPLFNSGRGAALTAAGTVEHDAAVMTGDGRAGAVALSRHARHPVLLARAVRESDEVLIADPTGDFVAAYGLETCDNAWFATPERLERLAALRAGLPGAEPEVGFAANKHGTVGCVALDVLGHLAAATSTGGYDNKPVGRIGDTPIIGAGTYARDGVVAVSCTGRGESFIEGVVAHQVSARMELGGQDVVAAARTVIEREVTGRGTMGALIAVGATGDCVLAWDARTLLAAWRDGDTVRTHL
ncbi:MAG: isoaspartyl peptidase/L-asparaginase [Propionibacteriaceae bacterium]|jgi:beta-aspartyl-peptidase (threonine type)|nr:isoaspartyl peptidase/L-asparaginase [Propionibacteriaceae bacterium]